MTKGRWGLVAAAVLALVGAALFAFLPYSLAVGPVSGSPNGRETTRCDSAFTQQFGSPELGNVDVALDKRTGAIVTTVDNIQPACVNVAHYRIGIAAGLLALALALGVVVFVAIRHGRDASEQDVWVAA